MALIQSREDFRKALIDRNLPLEMEREILTEFEMSRPYRNMATQRRSDWIADYMWHTIGETKSQELIDFLDTLFFNKECQCLEVIK